MLIDSLQSSACFIGLGPCFSCFLTESLSCAGMIADSCAVIFKVSASMVFCILAIISIWAETMESSLAILVSSSISRLDLDDATEDVAKLPGELCFVNRRELT